MPSTMMMMTTKKNNKASPQQQHKGRGGFWMIRRRNSPAVDYSSSSLPTVVVSSSQSSPWDTNGNDPIPEEDVDEEEGFLYDEENDDDLSTNSSNSSGEIPAASPLEIIVSTSNDKNDVDSQHKKTKPKKSPPKWRQPVDVESYMARREMTKTQERWNALTMVPYPIYCLYFVLTAQWFNNNDGTMEDASSTQAAVSSLGTSALSSTLLQSLFGPTDEYGCLPPSRWHSMPSLPPLPVLAVAFGVTAHAPFSFLYHWCYAHTLPPTARSQHWSRRMDQFFIHVCSIFACCGTATSLDYILANALFNIDCALQHVRSDVKPRRNQVRCGISLLLYTAPLLSRDATLFCQLWLVFSTSIWFFVAYPIGGWSHSVFHLIMALGPPLTLRAAAGISDTSLAQLCWMQQQQQ